MRHRVARQRLNQKPAHARLLKRNLVTMLLLYESIRTTRPRARAIQPMVDRLLRAARTQSEPVAIRAINRVVTDQNACRKIMEVLKKRYADRHSGLTTVRAAGVRAGDGAPLVDLTLLDAELDEAIVVPETPAIKEAMKTTTASKAAKKPAKKAVAKKTS